jgi:hypothetical protein
MGCHTWFYKKAKDPSDDVMRSVIKDRCEKEIDFLNRLIHHRNEIDQDLLESYPEWTPEWATESKEFWTRLAGFLDGGELTESDKERLNIHLDIDVDSSLIHELYAFWSSSLTVYVKDKGFYDEAEFHDAFRRGGYPDDRLFSLEETLNYIKDPENKCSVDDYTEDTLKRFWERHPDGMIQFG